LTTNDAFAIIDSSVYRKTNVDSTVNIGPTGPEEEVKMLNIECRNMASDLFHQVVAVIEALPFVAPSHSRPITPTPPANVCKVCKEPFAHIWTSGRGISNGELFRLIMHLLSICDVTADLPEGRFFISVPRTAYVLICAQRKSDDPPRPRAFTFNLEAAREWQAQVLDTHWFAKVDLDTFPAVSEVLHYSGTPNYANIQRFCESTTMRVGLSRSGSETLQGLRSFTTRDNRPPQGSSHL